MVDGTAAVILPDVKTLLAQRAELQSAARLAINMLSDRHAHRADVCHVLWQALQETGGLTSPWVRQNLQTIKKGTQ